MPGLISRSSDDNPYRAGNSSSSSKERRYNPAGGPKSTANASNVMPTLSLYPKHIDEKSLNQLSLENLLREHQSVIPSARPFSGRPGQEESAFALIRNGAKAEDAIAERFSNLNNRGAVEEWRAFVAQYPIPGASRSKSQPPVVPKIQLHNPPAHPSSSSTSTHQHHRVPDGTPPPPRTAATSNMIDPNINRLPRYKDGQHIHPDQENRYKDGRKIDDLTLLIHRKEAENELKKQEEERLRRIRNPPVPGAWVRAQDGEHGIGKTDPTDPTSCNDPTWVPSEEALISSELVGRVLFAENWHLRKLTSKHLDSDFRLLQLRCPGMPGYGPGMISGEEGESSGDIGAAGGTDNDLNPALKITDADRAYFASQEAESILMDRILKYPSNVLLESHHLWPTLFTGNPRVFKRLTSALEGIVVEENEKKRREQYVREREGVVAGKGEAKGGKGKGKNGRNEVSHEESSSSYNPKPLLIAGLAEFLLSSGNASTASLLGHGALQRRAPVTISESSQFFFLSQTAWLNGRERDFPFLQELLFRAFLSLSETDLLYLVENLYGSFFSRPMLLAFRERCNRERKDLGFFFAKAGDGGVIRGGRGAGERGMERAEELSPNGPSGPGPASGRKRKLVRGDEPGAGLGSSALIPIIVRRARLEPTNLSVVVDILALLIDRKDPRDLRSYASRDEAMGVVEFLLEGVKDLGRLVLWRQKAMEAEKWNERLHPENVDYETRNEHAKDKNILRKITFEDTAEYDVDADVRFLREERGDVVVNMAMGKYGVDKYGNNKRGDRGRDGDHEFSSGKALLSPASQKARDEKNEEDVSTLRKICKALFHSVRTDKTVLSPFVQSHRWVLELEKRTKDPTIKTYLGMILDT